MNEVDFDDYAKNYREVHTENIHSVTGADSDYFCENKVRIISEKHPPGNQQIRILDLGCGDGLAAKYFKKYFPEMHYDGVDVSAESIKKAEEANIAGADFVVYDGRHVPFADETFDVILVSCVLHHVPHEQHKELLGECLRVLRSTGTVYVFEHNPYNPVTQKVVKDCPFDADAHLISARKINRIIRDLGGDVENLLYYVFPEV